MPLQEDAIHPPHNPEFLLKFIIPSNPQKPMPEQEECDSNGRVSKIICNRRPRTAYDDATVLLEPIVEGFPEQVAGEVVVCEGRCGGIQDVWYLV